jgi:DNA ligase-1
MERFATTAERIARQPAKLEKIALLAEYLGDLSDADLIAAARFFSGNPFAARERRTLSLGGRTIVEVARRVYGFDEAALGSGYRATGDLGTALGALARAPADAMLFREHLTPALLDELFGEIAAASGKHASKRRSAVFERILRAADDPSVATYVVKIVTGDLRVGLREGLVLEAIARAFGAEASEIRRAVMAAGDVGEVALAAKHGTPVPYGEAYAELSGAKWILEDKYDGIRAQAHVRGQTVRLFSRRLNDITASYPELVSALGAIGSDAILDGEIVAMRDGRVLPFRSLQARLQRKRVDAALLQDVPLTYVIFDLLAIGDDLLIDEPLSVRRERLAERLEGSVNAKLVLAPFEGVGEARASFVNERFEAARARGNEGLVFKRVDAPYLPGRRGKWWLKLKRELSTLDVAVVAVEWGNGKRAGVLSDYTFAVRADDGSLQTIGKAYSGLTDAEIAGLTPWFLQHRLPPERQREKARAHEIPVEPNVVIEVAFDIVAKSQLHESGFALRFPRIVRIRDDKPVEEIDTLARVREIHREMLAREGHGAAAVTRPRPD